MGADGVGGCGGSGGGRAAGPSGPEGGGRAGREGGGRCVRAGVHGGCLRPGLVSPTPVLAPTPPTQTFRPNPDLKIPSSSLSV